MAPARRRHSPDLRDRLQREPHRFGFHQALRLLSLMEPKVRRHAGLPASLRFRTQGSLGFPSSEISAFRRVESPQDESVVEELEVTFMGLTGPSGVLPTPYTEMVQERRAHHHDEGLHRFLDIFSHRAIALMAEAWRKSRFWHAHELDGESTLTRALQDLSGLSQARLDSLPAHSLAFYAGTFARGVPSASSLALALSGWLQRPATLEPFVGQWIHVDAQEQSQIGRSSATLGQDAFLGARVWDRQSKVRLRVGPLPADLMEAFLPGGSAAKGLTQILRHSLGLAASCDLVLVVEGESIRPLRFRPGGMRLGYDTWLSTRPLSGLREDLRYPLLGGPLQPPAHP